MTSRRPVIGVTVSRRSGWRIFPLIALNVWLAGGRALRWQAGRIAEIGAVLLSVEAMTSRRISMVGGWSPPRALIPTATRWNVGWCLLRLNMASLSWESVGAVRCST